MRGVGGELAHLPALGARRRRRRAGRQSHDLHAAGASQQVERGRARAGTGRRQQRGIRQLATKSDRADAGGPGRVRRIGVELLPCVEGGVAATPPGTGKEALQPRCHQPLRHRPETVWSWDITWMPTAVKGQYYYWYMVLDVFSRKIVGHEVQTVESAELASLMIRRASLAEGLAGRPLVLHSDNGSAMKGSTMLATLEQLGVAPSFSRPRVSNDNAYAESLFRTCKYRPDYPRKPFGSLDEARVWTQKFVRWYNQEHKHSGLKFVTPAQRHDGLDTAILARRKQVYAEARNRNPRRWSLNTRDWTLEDQVWLNPERIRPEELKQAA